MADFLNNADDATPGEVLAAQFALDTIADWFSENDVTEILDGSARMFEILEAVEDLASGVYNDYWWAWDNPDTVLQELPPWLSDALAPIFGTLGVGPFWGISYSPLVLDIDGNGAIDLTNLNGSDAYFDFWGDGVKNTTPANDNVQISRRMQKAA